MGSKCNRCLHRPLPPVSVAAVAAIEHSSTTINRVVMKRCVRTLKLVESGFGLGFGFGLLLLSLNRRYAAVRHDITAPEIRELAVLVARARYYAGRARRVIHDACRGGRIRSHTAMASAASREHA